MQTTTTTNNPAHTLAPAMPTSGHRQQRASRLADEALRVSLALILMWFGALKAAGASAVTDLVASTVDAVPLVTGEVFVRVVGIGEVALGLWLLAGRPRKVVLGVTVVHLLTASLVAVAVRPDLVFQQGDPLLLTVTGQFVMKNLALVFATAVLALRDPAGQTPTLRTRRPPRTGRHPRQGRG